MYLVFKSEVLHRREHLGKRIENLCHGRYLPVEVPAINPYTKGKRARPYQNCNSLGLEHNLDIVEPEVLCCVHKLWETWNGERELLEESNMQVFEARGRDPTNNRFQISANASEPEEAKVRKCNVCRDWGTCELPLHITVGNRECKDDLETL